jgi:DNA-directed RNA polymerase alpha subunit
MRAIRLTSRDHAELVAYLTPYFDKKRGMFPKGHIPVVSLGSEPINALPKVIVRVIDKANGKESAKQKPIKKQIKKSHTNINIVRIRPLSGLDLSKRVYNKLITSPMGIVTIGDLYELIDEVYQIPNFGAQSVKECRDKLKTAGFKFD